MRPVRTPTITAQQRMFLGLLQATHPTPQPIRAVRLVTHALYDPATQERLSSARRMMRLRDPYLAVYTGRRTQPYRLQVDHRTLAITSLNAEPAAGGPRRVIHAPAWLLVYVQDHTLELLALADMQRPPADDMGRFSLNKGLPADMGGQLVQLVAEIDAYLFLDLRHLRPRLLALLEATRQVPALVPGLPGAGWDGLQGWLKEQHANNEWTDIRLLGLMATIANCAGLPSMARSLSKY